jgi:hypothetical protein
MRISVPRRCCPAGAPVQNKFRLLSEFLLEGYMGKEAGGKAEFEKRGWDTRTFFSRDFSEFSSFWAFFACRLSDFAVNCGTSNRNRQPTSNILNWREWAYLELE